MAGYIGNRAGGLATVAERKTVFTATSGQTTFTVSSGYTPNNVHVFQNGVRLVDGTDYTATNGSTVVLTTGASTDDQIVVIAAASYQNADSYTKAESDSALGGTQTFNRTSTDGAIVTLQKDGTTVGSIGTSSGVLTVDKSGGGGLYIANGGTFPRYNGALSDNTQDLGGASYRWQDLYLSGGVYLGGTGSANYLDDYETGSWSPTIATGSASFSYATYVKTGDMVTVSVFIAGFTDRTTATSVIIGGLPFTTDGRFVGSIMGRYLTNGSNQIGWSVYAPHANTTMLPYGVHSSGYGPLNHTQLNSSNAEIYMTLTYRSA